ncbi:MAG TPA: PAS domain S-box protein, partial [Dehalococcoidia bacterium]|nr:PAS domain S-box protein [Dehalococcoidia bacterium]
MEIALYKHQVERDLSSTRSRLDATLTSISDGVVVTNTEGDICMINPMAEKITGWCKQKTQQMKLSDLMPLSPFPHEAVFDTRTIDVQDKVMNLRQHLRTADGGQLPIEVS